MLMFKFICTVASQFTRIIHEDDAWSDEKAREVCATTSPRFVPIIFQDAN